MDFRRLESFVKVADLKSFSRAAEVTYLTQPTISGHIQGLEREFGTRFFDRGKRGITLTGAGEVLYGFAKKLLSLREEARQALDDYTGLVRGELRVGGSTIPGEYILPGIIGRFKKSFPGLALTLRIGDTLTICNELLKGDVELAVVGAKLYENRIQYQPFFGDEVILVAQADHPVARKGRITLRELCQLDLVLREEGSATRLILERNLSEKGIPLRELKVVAVLGSTAAVKEAIFSGLGLSFMSRRSVEKELKLGLLKGVKVEYLNSLKRRFFVATLRNRSLSPGARTFLDALSREKEGAGPPTASSAGLKVTGHGSP